MNDISEVFGTVLREMRNEQSLSQEKLAFMSGLDRTYISLLERGKRKATIQTLFALTKSLNVNPSCFLKEMEKLIDGK